MMKTVQIPLLKLLICCLKLMLTDSVRYCMWIVVVEGTQVELEADGTIRSRDALAWYAQDISKHAHYAEVVEVRE